MLKNARERHSVREGESGVRVDDRACEWVEDSSGGGGGGGGSSSGGGGEDGIGEGAEGASLTRSRSINRHKLVAHSTAMESIQADSDPIDEEDQVP